MAYWLPDTVDRELGRRIDYMGSSQFGRVGSGDTLWIVTVREGSLRLVGRMRVGEIVDEATALARTGRDDLWNASLHAIAEPGRGVVASDIDISDIAEAIEIESRDRPRLMINAGRVNPQSLQRMRVITPGTVELLQRRLGDAGAFGGAADEIDATSLENRIEREISESQTIEPTVKEALIKARRGQGLFRERVLRLEKRCRVTGVEDARHLTASHIKPWCVSDDSERLDAENGLVLTPNVDHLFDNGFISFADEGTILLSPVVDRAIVRSLGVDLERNVGGFSTGQRRYLSFHRSSVFRKGSG